MNNRAVIVALALLLSTPLALAQQQDSEAHHPADAPTVDTTGSSSPPAEPAPATTPMESVMAQKLEEMQSHWDKMLQTQDPAERQKLMEEHRQEMRELHAMMRGAQGGQGMMGSGQGMMGGGRGMMGGGQGMGMMHGSQDMDKRDGCRRKMHYHQQVERRLEVIQKLLEQVLENQIKS